jgi:hypothetical protein
MAKIFQFKSVSDSDLNRLKTGLLARMRIPASVLRASKVEQFLTCGKKNCRCRRGHKHGPFQYLVQCLAVGKVRKFLLKSEAQRKQADASIAGHVAFQEQMEELSQINTELLRRGLPLDGMGA